MQQHLRFDIELREQTGIDRFAGHEVARSLAVEEVQRWRNLCPRQWQTVGNGEESVAVWRNDWCKTDEGRRRGSSGSRLGSAIGLTRGRAVQLISCGLFF